MSVLKIKNSSNQWESVPTIKGDTGVGVESIEQTTTSTESGGTNIITATLTDGTTSEFYIKNGEAGSGGGGGGTSNYNDLTNKPSINNVTLTGNKTTSDLGINIPTSTSDLTNDSGFITSSSLPTKTSDLTNDSGFITSSSLPTKVSDLTNDVGYITSYTETDPIYSASAASGITSTDITNWNNKSDFSGSYTDLTNKPTIPTVNNATLTIQKNGTTVKTFTANASSNVTANITVPTQTSDLTNNSGYITKSVSDLTNYTPTNSLATVATSGSYNDLSDTPTIPTVPTNVSAFTNDSGYITGITSSDIYNVLGYYPAAEPSIYTYSSIRQITSISDGTYISLMDDITNDRPIVISLGATEYVDVLGTNNGTTTSLWFITSDNTYTKITLTVSGTSVTVTTENIEIPTKTSDLTNDSGFVTSSYHDNTKQDLINASTNWGTVASGCSGSLPYIKIGNVVFLSVMDYKASSDITVHDTLLGSNLPKATTEIVFLSYRMDMSSSVRMRITTAGELRLHYSRFPASYNEIYGLVVYTSSE